MRRLLLGGLVVCVAAAGLALWTFRDFRAPTATGSAASVDTCDPPAAIPGAAVALSGRICARSGEPVARSRVAITYVGTDGQVIWRSGVRLTGVDGTFRFEQASLLPLSTAAAAVVVVEADGYIADKRDLALLASAPAAAASGTAPAAVIFQPAATTMVLKPVDRILLLWFLLPGFAGLGFAVLHLTRLSEGPWVTRLFAASAAGTWILACVQMTRAYVRLGHDLVPLFFDEVLLSLGVPIFAFLGVFTYAAYSVYQRGDELFIPAGRVMRRHMLLTVGARIYIAPYVAAVAHSILTTVYPNLRGGAASLFLGFFTGLYIKVVLEALNDIGTRFLSAEQTARVVEHLKDETRTTANATVASTSAANLQADPAFLSALGRARADLLKLEGVVGVAPGVKESGTDPDAGQPAIIAYVYDKKDLKPADPARVPDHVDGFPTDVRALPTTPEGRCSVALAFVEWTKVHHDHVQARADVPPVPSASPVERIGDVLVLTAVQEQVFKPTSEDGRLFDAIAAFRLARAGFPELASRFDFIAFVLDWQSYPVNFLSDYYIPVFNDVAGVGFYRDPDLTTRFDDRASWGLPSTARLRGCQIHYWQQPLANCIHELGHAWSAYVSSPRALTVDGMHWAADVDSGDSPMDHDGRRWTRTPNGRFLQEPIPGGRFVFCDLDLYLMGLLDRSRVKPVSIIDAPDESLISPQPGHETVVTVDQIVASSGGARVPGVASQPKTFRQAFVIVTGDRASGGAKAQSMIQAGFFAAHQSEFGHATKGLASIDATLG